MKRLYGSWQGKTYALEIRRRQQSSPPLYECVIAGPDAERVSITVQLISRAGARWTLSFDGRIQDLVVSNHDGQLLVDWDNRSFRLRLADPKDDAYPGSQAEESRDTRVTAPLTGKVVAVSRRAGERVEAGEALVAIEAMKMLNQIASPRSANITRCHISEGQVVKAGDLLFELE
jgi:3-methylcrotonyl-CoA carboxylase alpha subunit